MANIANRLGRKLWSKAFGEDSSVRRFENFRTRENYGLIQRANYVYGMLRAADVAKYFGKKSTDSD